MRPEVLPWQHAEQQIFRHFLFLGELLGPFCNEALKIVGVFLHPNQHVVQDVRLSVTKQHVVQDVRFSVNYNNMLYKMFDFL